MMSITFRTAHRMLCGWVVLLLFSFLSLPASAQSSMDEGVAITSFTLIDARDDVAIPAYDPIPEGAIINLEVLEAKQLAIRANVTEQVGSISIALRNRERLENVWPFALFGDIYGDYVGRTFKAGVYAISATPYSEDFRAGIKGPTKLITIEFVREEEAASIVEELAGYPNPFNPQTTVYFEISKSAHVELKVFDMLGREVAVLVDRTLASGNHNAIFEASGLPSGVYYARLVASGDVVTQQLLLMK